MHREARAASALPALLLAVAAVGAFAVAAPASAFGWDCDATAYRPKKVGPTTMEFRGRATCDVVMDVINVRVCQQRYVGPGDGWDTLTCRSRAAANRSQAMLAFDAPCLDGRRYRTRAHWSGQKDGWGGGELVFVYSDPREC